MPKRKNSDYEQLQAKIRKLERKICRRGRRRLSSSSDASENSNNDSLDGSQQEERHCRRSGSRSAAPTSNIDNNIPAQMLSSEASDPPMATTSAIAAADAEPQAEPLSQQPQPLQPPQPSQPPEHCAGGTAVTAEPAPVDESSILAGTESAVVTELDGEILQILGEDPTQPKMYGSEIQKDLAVRLEHYVTNGLSKENRKEIKEKYLLPINCKLLDAPALNAEIKAAISDPVAKRDKNIEIRQKQISAVISGLSQAMSSILKSSEKNPELLQTLMDAARLLCDAQHNDSVIRRNFVLSSLKKDLKDRLVETKVDSTLFGQNLAETLKAAKAINKSGAELKATPAPKPQGVSKKPLASTSKNWKNPPSTYRKKPDPPRTKETPSMKTRQSSSSKTSQQRTNRSRR